MDTLQFILPTSHIRGLVRSRAAHTTWAAKSCCQTTWPSLLAPESKIFQTSSARFCLYLVGAPAAPTSIAHCSQHATRSAAVYMLVTCRTLAQ